MYQHDPSKIAVCWNFLQGNCSNSAETCPLSHDPTPERTPLCVHFLNKGRCTRDNCPFPHINVGQRHGVCKDFAVLGYCNLGLNCDKQHVRECPEFADTGTCSHKKCKLPHVIRANRKRVLPKAAGTSPTVATIQTTEVIDPQDRENGVTDGASGQIGDEYISLTFMESSDEDDEDEEDDAENESDWEVDDDQEKGSDENPDSVSVHV
jgi:hypothetical protein